MNTPVIVKSTPSMRAAALCAAFATSLALTGCGTTLSASYRIGDGKAFVSSDGSSYNVGYRGTFGSRPPTDGKASIPPDISSPSVGWLDQVKGWFR